MVIFVAAPKRPAQIIGNNGGAAMKIDRKVAKGYEIRCDCNRAFVTGRLGPSVECPYCGHTALSADLVAEFYAPKAETAKAKHTAAA
jgi:hypothetical protein